MRAKVYSKTGDIDFVTIKHNGTLECMKFMVGSDPEAYFQNELEITINDMVEIDGLIEALIGFRKNFVRRYGFNPYNER